MNKAQIASMNNIVKRTPQKSFGTVGQIYCIAPKINKRPLIVVISPYWNLFKRLIAKNTAAAIKKPFDHLGIKTTSFVNAIQSKYQTLN